MPIYMDRHQGKNITAESAARAHAADIKIQDEYGCKFITYWFDQENETVFCLVDAPDMGSVQRVHQDAHGFGHSEIMEVDPNIVKAFLGRVEDPSPHSGDLIIESPIRAIMFTDLEGSTQMIDVYGDDKALELLRIHNKLTRDALQHHGGREVKHTGDGFMVSFASAVSAVECAIDVQRAMDQHNIANEEARMNLRVGISAGEPVRNDKQLYGATVNLAARLCDHAKPGSILVAQVVKDLSAGKMFPFVEGGEFEAKGFDQPILLFEVAWKDN